MNRAIAYENVKNTPNRGDITRDALIKTATEIFARDGYDGTGTRAIADAASVNQALINYHFGNKHGLYLAVFENIATQMKMKLGSKISQLLDVSSNINATNEDCLDAIINLINLFIDTIIKVDSTDKARLILREQQNPTEAFEIIYNAFMGPILEAMSKILLKLRPNLSEQQAKLKVFCFFSQISSLRAARSGILKFMNWHDFGDAETQIVKNQIKKNAYQLYFGQEDNMEIK